MHPTLDFFIVRMLSIAIWNHLICYSIQIAIWKLLILDWLELLMLEMMFKFILNMLLRGTKTRIYHPRILHKLYLGGIVPQK